MITTRKLDRYVAAYFISSYIICFIFFLGLFIVIDLVPKVDDILEAAPLVKARGESLFFVTLLFYCYKVPEIFLMVAPYLTVMSAMFCISRLKKNNELVPMIMAGISIFRVLLPVFILAGSLMFCMVAVQEGLAPWCVEKRMLSKDLLLKHKEKLIIEKEVFMFIDSKNRDIEIVVHNYNVATRVADRMDVVFVKQDKGMQFNVSIIGKNLRWLGPDEAAWSMVEGVQVERAISNTGVQPRKSSIKRFRTDLTPDDILRRIKEPSDMTFQEIRREYAMNPDDCSKKILLHHHLTFPLSNIILLLLGVPFVLRPESRSNFLGVTIALLICGAYFVLDVIMQDLGAKDQINPILASWFATIFCGTIGIYLFDSIKT